MAVGHTSLHPESRSDAENDHEDGQGNETGMQPAVALIGDSKHNKQKDESADELGR
jgi:hypothetical protein